jgi:uncharacterized protein YbjT (DUF2867 family)
MRSPGTRAAWSTCHRSAYETTRNGIDPINQLHADIERLIERTGLAWTFLRASGFATNALWWAPQIRADGVVRAPYGAAVRSSIHERDIAAVAVRALTGDGHAGAQHLLTGPQALTQVEQVRAIGEAIGRPLRYEEIARETARQQLLAAMPFGRGWHPRRPREVRDRAGAGAAHRGGGRGGAGAHVPRMGDRPRRRLPLRSIERLPLRRRRFSL